MGGAADSCGADGGLGTRLCTCTLKNHDVIATSSARAYASEIVVLAYHDGRRLSFECEVCYR